MTVVGDALEVFGFCTICSQIVYKRRFIMEAATLQAKPFTPFQIEIFLLPSNHKADRQYG
jgi:hypothetical protein